MSCAYDVRYHTSSSVGRQRQRREHGGEPPSLSRFAVHLLDCRDAVNSLFHVSFVSLLFSVSSNVVLVLTSRGRRVNQNIDNGQRVTRPDNRSVISQSISH